MIVNSSDQKKSRKRPKSGGLPEDETYGAEDGQMESDDDDELNLTGVAHVRKVSPKQKKASRKSKVPKTRIEEAAPLQVRPLLYMGPYTEPSLSSPRSLWKL